GARLMPRVVDIRSGLTEEVIDGLQRATRVILAVKNPKTAVLGYWLDDELTIALIKGSGGLLIKIPPQPLLPAGPIQQLRIGRTRAEGVLRHIRKPASDGFWDRVLSVVRPGDVLYLSAETNELGRHALHVEADGARVASLLLPKRGQRRRSAA